MDFPITNFGNFSHVQTNTTTTNDNENTNVPIRDSHDDEALNRAGDNIDLLLSSPPIPSSAHDVDQINALFSRLGECVDTTATTMTAATAIPPAAVPLTANPSLLTTDDAPTTTVHQHNTTFNNANKNGFLSAGQSDVDAAALLFATTHSQPLVQLAVTNTPRGVGGVNDATAAEDMRCVVGGPHLPQAKSNNHNNSSTNIPPPPIPDHQGPISKDGVITGEHGSWCSANIFVANIPSFWTEESLREHYSPFGTIISCKAVPSRRFGFVRFSTVEEAQRAIIETDKKRPTPGLSLLLHVSMAVHDEGDGSQPNNRIFVRGLPEWTTDQLLYNAVKDLCTPNKCSILIDAQRKCKGTAFVEFDTVEEASRLMEAADKVVLTGGPNGERIGTEGSGVVGGGGCGAESFLELKYSEPSESRLQRAARNKERVRKHLNEKVRVQGAVVAQHQQQQQMSVVGSGGQQQQQQLLYAATQQQVMMHPSSTANNYNHQVQQLAVYNSNNNGQQQQQQSSLGGNSPASAAYSSNMAWNGVATGVGGGGNGATSNHGSLPMNMMMMGSSNNAGGMAVLMGQHQQQPPFNNNNHHNNNQNLAFATTTNAAPTTIPVNISSSPATSLQQQQQQQPTMMMVGATNTQFNPNAMVMVPMMGSTNNNTFMYSSSPTSTPPTAYSQPQQQNINSNFNFNNNNSNASAHNNTQRNFLINPSIPTNTNNNNNNNTNHGGMSNNNACSTPPTMGGGFGGGGSAGIISLVADPSGGSPSLAYTPQPNNASASNNNANAPLPFQSLTPTGLRHMSIPNAQQASSSSFGANNMNNNQFNASCNTHDSFNSSGVAHPSSFGVPSVGGGSSSLNINTRFTPRDGPSIMMGGSASSGGNGNPNMSASLNNNNITSAMVMNGGMIGVVQQHPSTLAMRNHPSLPALPLSAAGSNNNNNQNSGNRMSPGQQQELLGSMMVSGPLTSHLLPLVSEPPTTSPATPALPPTTTTTTADHLANSGNLSSNHSAAASSVHSTSQHRYPQQQQPAGGGSPNYSNANFTTVSPSLMGAGNHPSLARLGSQHGSGSGGTSHFMYSHNNNGIPAKHPVLASHSNGNNNSTVHHAGMLPPPPRYPGAGDNSDYGPDSFNNSSHSHAGSHGSNNNNNKPLMPHYYSGNHNTMNALPPQQQQANKQIVRMPDGTMGYLQAMKTSDGQIMQVVVPMTN